MTQASFRAGMWGHLLCLGGGLLSCPVSVWLRLESQLSPCPPALLSFSEEPWMEGQELSRRDAGTCFSLTLGFPLPCI